MQVPTIVHIDEIVFLPINVGEPSELEAYGVTTCICLALYGHTSNGSSFIGMYHWSGFNHGGERDEETVSVNVYSLVSQLVTSAREQLELDESEPLFLDSISVIGGERRQEAGDGTLLLSGTEFEVNALNRHLRTQCRKEFICSDTTDFSFHSYLTSGEATLTVKMNHINQQPDWLVSEAENGIDMDGFSPRF